MRISKDLDRSRHRRLCQFEGRLKVEIDRYTDILAFYHNRISVWKNYYYYFLFVTYTIIQSITSSEMRSLYLTHPSAHTLGAVDTVHSGNAPVRPPHVTFNKIRLFETR